MAVEIIKSGQLVSITDTNIHEYAFDASKNQSMKPENRNGMMVQTIKVIARTGQIKYAVGADAPDGSSNVYSGQGAFLDSFVCDIISGVSNLKILGTNPSSFVVEL